MGLILILLYYKVVIIFFENHNFFLQTADKSFPILTRISKDPPTHTHANTHTYTHTHPPNHTHTHTHIHTQSPPNRHLHSSRRSEPTAILHRCVTLSICVTLANLYRFQRDLIPYMYVLCVPPPPSPPPPLCSTSVNQPFWPPCPKFPLTGAQTRNKLSKKRQ